MTHKRFPLSHVKKKKRMKVGDLVKHIPYADKNYGFGVVMYVDDMHRQTTMHVLFSKGVIGPIWEKYLEVLNESR